MKVLFIHSTISFDRHYPISSFKEIHFGVGYVEALLAAYNHETNILPLNRSIKEKNLRIVDDVIKKFEPGLVCFSSVFCEYAFISFIAKHVKKHYPSIFTIAGGVHVSLNPEKVIMDGFDALCVGEGEWPTLELCAQLDMGKFPSKISNLWINKGNEIEKNSPRPFIDDLDDIPFPNRLKWEPYVRPQTHQYTKQKQVQTVLLGRGCPFKCSYCSNHALREISAGTYVRFRSPENIVEEVKELSRIFPEMETLYLEVETIGVKTQWGIDLSDKLAAYNRSRKTPLQFITNLRIIPGVDNDELFKSFKRSNIKTIRIGLESGNEIIRREVLQRNYSNEDIKRNVDLARKYSLDIEFYVMVGFPGETRKIFQDTIKLTRECNPKSVALNVFMPYPGTKLYFECKEKGYIDASFEKALTKFSFEERKQTFMRLPNFSKREIRMEYLFFEYNVFKGLRRMERIIYRLLISLLPDNRTIHIIRTKAVKIIKMVIEIQRIK